MISVVFFLVGVLLTIMFGVQAQLVISKNPRHIYFAAVWTFAESLIWYFSMHYMVMDVKKIPAYAAGSAFGAAIAFLMNQRLRGEERSSTQPSMRSRATGPARKAPGSSKATEGASAMTILSQSWMSSTDTIFRSPCFAFDPLYVEPTL